MLPDKLKTLRKKAKLTQVEISQKLKISQPAYVEWEKGRAQPTPDKLPLLAEILNTSIDYLLGKTDIKNSSELTETDITEILNNGVISYDGKPMTEHDKEILTQVIKDYFDGKLKDYD